MWGGSQQLIKKIILINIKILVNHLFSLSYPLTATHDIDKTHSQKIIIVYAFKYNLEKIAH